MSRVFTARRITWTDENGIEQSYYGVPAIVRTGPNVRTRSDRRRMFHTAKLHGVALIPIQWGEQMEHGHEAVIAWLALCDGDVKSIAAMSRFLEYSDLVTWEHCTMHAIPCGKTELGRKKRTSKPTKISKLQPWEKPHGPAADSSKPLEERDDMLSSHFQNL